MTHYAHTRLASLTLAVTVVISVACASRDAATDSGTAQESTVARASEQLSLSQAALAQWSSIVALPIVPVSAANLPDGTVLLWSAADRFGFSSDQGRTFSVLYDPATGAVTERLVSETGHEMFCPGTANLPDGRILVNGGLSSGATSIYNPETGVWTRASLMNIARAYEGTAPLQSGSVLTLGGSWAGGVGNKHGEVWTANDAWHRLPGVPIDPFLSVDDTRSFGMDSHLWLLAAGNGQVFHAGPGMEMHWIATDGDGAVTDIGPRGDDKFSINGNAIMYEAGKVLKIGGTPGYEGLESNSNAYVMELGADVTVRKLAPMAYRRAFHNSVPLPNGQVVIIGGETVGVGFSDNNSVLAPELFDPLTETFTVLPAMAVPRNYHSVALLLPDGRVLSAGGGLCGEGCAANHPDLQVLSPPYLFNTDGTLATRPVLLSSPAQAAHGALIDVTTDGPINAFSLVRLSSTTHTVNNDQRRLSLLFSETAPGHYAVQVPTNPGWAVPGMYMLFALNAAGVPSVARIIRIGSTTILPLARVKNQETRAGDPATLMLSATSPSGLPITYGATGLPDGLVLNASTGVISGISTSVGRYSVEVSASDGLQTVSTEFAWKIDMGDNDLPPVLATPTAPILALGAPVTLALQASDPDGDTLTYSATSLPPGLLLNPQTGIISGAATQSGTYTVNAKVSDGRGGVASVAFDWIVGVNPPSVAPVVAPLITSSSTASYTANVSGGGTLQFSYSFGDGTADSAFSSSPSITHKFAKPGVYIVTLTVRNTQGDYVTTQFLQAVGGAVTAAKARSSSNVVEETRSGLSSRVWIANIDNDTVSVFDRGTLTKVAEIPVGQAPRSLAIAPDGRIWVSNKASATLSVIDPISLSVEQTISLPRGSQPFGVVCGADGSVYVALEGISQALKLSSTGAELAKRALPGPARHLALTGAADRLLATRFISAPLPGESTAAVQTVVGTTIKGGELFVIAPSTLVVGRTVILRNSDKPDTTISGRGLPNYLGAPVISPDGLSTWIPSKQDNVLRGRLRDGRDLDFQNTVRAISSRVDLKSYAEDYAGRLDFDNSGVASAAAYDPSGAYLFVALEASRQVAVVDAFGRRELFRIEAGLAPQGVAVSADGRTLYVHNALGRSVGVYDLSPMIDTGARSVPLLVSLSTVAVEKLPPAVLRGKQLFYDARDTRLALDAYLSCAACHNDGGQDGRVWDLTSLGEGLRNTISLRGRGGVQGMLHWSGNFDEVQDFEGQIRALSRGTGLMTDAAFNQGTRSQPLGDAKAGISADLDALAAYVESLQVADASPYRLASGAMSSTAAGGRALFQRECQSCHGFDEFTDSPARLLHDIGTLKPISGQRLGKSLVGLDTPGLRGSWATPPYLHDGSAATLDAAILAHRSVNLTAAERAWVVAFVRELGDEEPPVPPVPGLYGQYFDNPTLTGPALWTRTSAVGFTWAASAPTGLPVDGFSVRWSGKVVATVAGSYKLRTYADDGVRLWVDGVLLIDTWNTIGLLTQTSAALTWAAGSKHDVRLEYQEVSGDARMQLFWQVPGASFVIIPAAQLEPGGSGLTSQYFTNNSLTESPVLTRYETPNFDWGGGSPDPSVPDNDFSARWSGSLSPPADGQYAFRTVSDDGVRLWLNGALIIDNWTAHAPTTNISPSIQLATGYHYDIKLEFQELGGGAVMQLNWLPPGAPAYSAVPIQVLGGN